MLLLLSVSFLFSCKKEQPISTVEALRFTAVVNVIPDSQALSYELYLSNDKNAPVNLWIFAKRITRAEILNSNLISFNFNGSICDSTLYANSNLKLYGATREVVAHGDRLEMNYNTVFDVIKNY